MKLSIVIPVYNEVNTVLEVIRRVKAVPIDKEIIIVDDGSTDGTKEVLNEIKDDNVVVLHNEKNRGKGFSIRKGFGHVTGDIVIIQDADLEYYPDEYGLMIQKIIEGKADVVYGTRFLGARRVFHFYHYLGNQILNIIANVLYDTNLTDLMACYKAFNASALKSLKLEADGFGIEAEMTAQVFKRRYRVYEVPISYDGRDYAEGKKITWKDFFRSCYWLIRCKLKSYDVGEDTLYMMRQMKNNTKWAFKQVQPYLGRVVLEVGSGIGNISNYLSSLNKTLILTDINDKHLEVLRRRFVGNPNIKVISHDIRSEDISNILPFKVDSIVCINVLEHIDNDDKALENMHKILNSGGRLILIVPALKHIYGILDEKLGHYRRYDKGELIKKLEQRNFIVEKIYHYNLIASIGWFINARILKRRVISTFQIRVLDDFIPLVTKAEKIIKIPFGLSLIAICKKK